MSKSFWLMKTEPACYSIDDLLNETITSWDGIRNYQARNFMRDKMQIGDGVLFYHSSTNPAGVTGLAKVCKTAYPDHTAQDPENRHFDPKASKEKPIWMMIDVEFIEKFNKLISISELRSYPELDGMLLFQKGQRLSIQPVEKKHFDFIVKLSKI